MCETSADKIKELVKEKKINLINCETINKVFHRYFPLSRLEEMLNEKKLTFVNPKLWNDPYETLYLNTDYSSISNGYKQPKIFCLCARSTDDNEEASWKVYSNGREPLLRVRFHIEKLLANIYEFASKYDCKVYYSKIFYGLEYDQIREIKYRQELRAKFLDSFNEEKYIRLMSLKRPSFGYEKEYRLFIVPKDDSKQIFQKDILKIPIKVDVFERFTINPLERIREEDAMKLSSLIKKAQYESQSEIIECFIMTRVPHIKKLHRSFLYRNIDSINNVALSEQEEVDGGGKQKNNLIYRR